MKKCFAAETGPIMLDLGWTLGSLLLGSVRGWGNYPTVESQPDHHGCRIC